MYGNARELLLASLQEIRDAGLYKLEHALVSPQATEIRVQDNVRLLNLSANNYLGLANNPEVIAAAQEALERWGYGLASVRFICGTQSLHKQLEQSLSEFLGTEDSILYSSCFDANGGLFETIVGPDDAVISDKLNHASIIDGIRLCKAKRFVYDNKDMNQLEERLFEARSARIRLIATDGVFSMDGSLANLPAICALADKYQALVMVDDSHAVGFMGAQGRGSHEHFGVTDRVDIITGTFGKALGGASGGFTSGKREIIELLRQRSRPYLFSNSLPPSIVAASIKAIEITKRSIDLRARLFENTKLFRDGITRLGYRIIPGEHPIVPIILESARTATQLAERMLRKGVYVVGFSYPVVPLDQARVRAQISAAHSPEQIDWAICKFGEAKRELDI